MFPAKAHGPTVFDFNSVGVDAACCHQATEGSAPVYGHALGHATYERHRPEQTLLYRLMEKHYPALVEQLEVSGQKSADSCPWGV